MKNISEKRRERANKKVTTKGERDGRCLHQSIHDVGKWATGEVKQMIRYYHVTKGWRTRVLPPIYNNALTFRR